MAVVLKCVPKTNDPLQPPQPPTEGKIVLKDTKSNQEFECDVIAKEQ